MTHFNDVRNNKLVKFLRDIPNIKSNRYCLIIVSVKVLIACCMVLLKTDTRSVCVVLHVLSAVETGIITSLSASESMFACLIELIFRILAVSHVK